MNIRVRKFMKASFSEVLVGKDSFTGSDNSLINKFNLVPLLLILNAEKMC